MIFMKKRKDPSEVSKNRSISAKKRWNKFAPEKKKKFIDKLIQAKKIKQEKYARGLPGYMITDYIEKNLWKMFNRTVDGKPVQLTKEERSKIGKELYEKRDAEKEYKRAIDSATTIRKKMKIPENSIPLFEKAVKMLVNGIKPEKVHQAIINELSPLQKKKYSKISFEEKQHKNIVIANRIIRKAVATAQSILDDIEKREL